MKSRFLFASIALLIIFGGIFYALTRARASIKISCTSESEHLKLRCTNLSSVYSYLAERHVMDLGVHAPLQIAVPMHNIVVKLVDSSQDYFRVFPPEDKGNTYIASGFEMDKDKLVIKVYISQEIYNKDPGLAERGFVNQVFTMIRFLTYRDEQDRVPATFFTEAGNAIVSRGLYENRIFRIDKL